MLDGCEKKLDNNIDNWDNLNGGSLAQRLEQFAHNELVVGSNPTGPTILLYLVSLYYYTAVCLCK